MSMQESRLDQSSRTVKQHTHTPGEKSDAQGELKIKFTDCAKQPDITQSFIRDVQPGKSEQFQTNVEFAMAYGETQNFS